MNGGPQYVQWVLLFQVFLDGFSGMLFSVIAGLEDPEDPGDRFSFTVSALRGFLLVGVGIGLPEEDAILEVS